mmetsp:Transcript_64022/g.78304  ORF Transcript_64022/g.78304 Transcript_64022/m.78304 type:complete len:760 (+) Transcript_64022:90-2369(+)
MLQKMKMVSSRLLIETDDDDGDFDEKLSDEEKGWVINKCSEINEWDPNLCVYLWIRKIKDQDYKKVKRILVMTPHRLFTVRKTGAKKGKGKYEVRREGHILDLKSVQENGLKITITFRQFVVAFQAQEDVTVNQIISTLYKNYKLVDPGFPEQMKCKWLDQYKASQEHVLSKKMPVVSNNLAPWERPCRTFNSYASYYLEPNKQLSKGLKAIMRRPLDEFYDGGDERWLRTADLNISSDQTIHGLLISVAFTLNVIHGIEVTECKDESQDLLYACKTILQYNQTLKSLVLENCGSGPEWGKLLFDGLSKNLDSQLMRFGLINTKMGDKGMSYLVDGLKKISKQPECIYLTKSGVKEQTVVNLISSIKNQLTELDLSYNPLGQRGTQTLANKISKKEFSNLRILALSKCNVDMPRLLTALDSAQKKDNLNLEELDVSYNKMSSQDGLILSKILAHSGTCASLSVAGCKLNGATIAACIAAMLSNEELQFYCRINASDNNIGCEAAIMIASVFIYCDRIMSVQFNNCDLTHEGMGYILYSLTNHPRLKMLELECNCKRDQWNQGKFHVNQMLRKLLENCINLEHFSVKNDPERGYQVELDQFLYALRRNQSLLSVDISGNNMTSDNLIALKDVVMKNKILRELHWDNNNITSRQILGVIHALKNNKSLQIIDFPEHDWKKEYIKEKNKQNKADLEKIKRDFKKAVFDNNTLQGFNSKSVNMSTAAAKRTSVISTRPKPKYQANLQGNSLGIPEQKEANDEW